MEIDPTAFWPGLFWAGVLFCGCWIAAQVLTLVSPDARDD